MMENNGLKTMASMHEIWPLESDDIYESSEILRQDKEDKEADPKNKKEKNCIKETKKVKIADAAKEIGCAPEYLRRQMKAGRWDLGKVVKPSRGGCNYRYFIFRQKLDRFLGMEEEAKTAQ